MLVYVLNSSGQPLMPTRRFGKVRRMLKNNQAVIVNYEPFVIQLTYETTNYVQEVTLGVDTGSIHVGLSATTEKRELYASETDFRSKQVKQRLKSRSEARRRRRSRLRYRPARFNNRAKSKKKGWLAPSMQHRIDSHLRVIDNVSKILPIKKYVLEIGIFDTQKMANPDISGEEYQRGQTVGCANVKAFVRFRDKNKCRQCNGKSGDKRIQVHHIQHKEDGGPDRPDNMVCLCQTCHRQYHAGKIKLKKFQLNRANAKSLRDAAAMNIIKDRVLQGVKEKYPDKEVRTTYGYITRWNRAKYNIDKSHANDAYVIAGNFSAKQLDYYYKGFQVRRHNRQIHKDTIQKGGIPKNNQAEHLVFGFALNDRIRYNGEIYFIKGRRNKGFFSLSDASGKEVMNSVHHSRLKRISYEKSLIYKRISKF